MNKLKIMIVDDSAVARRLLTDALSAEPDFETVTAINGRMALDKLKQVAPDVVTLDVEMPDMDGLATLTHLRGTHPKLPVIMFSSITVRGAMATLDALAAGANDYVAKPSGAADAKDAVRRIREELVPRIKALCGRRRSPLPARAVAAPSPTVSPTTPPPAALLPTSTAAAADVVAIGVSTGGPNALSALMPMLAADLNVPVVIVQHMPPVFTKLLAERLTAVGKLPVTEAVHGQPLRPGQALLAPGGSHLVVARAGTQVVARLTEDAPENSCRPAVDVLFRSVAAVYGNRALGVVMTGMGSDGLIGCQHIAAAGGRVVVQDEATSVVWGMPGAVARANLAQKQLPLDRLAAEIVELVRGGRRHAA